MLSKTASDASIQDAVILALWDGIAIWGLVLRPLAVLKQFGIGVAPAFPCTTVLNPSPFSPVVATLLWVVGLRD